MLAFHNDPAIKENYLARVRAHRLADEIVQGRGYWRDGRGCAVGCTIHGDDHDAYERELGIPAHLAHLEDRIFENLPVHLSWEWPEMFLSAIRPGADLAKVWPQFAAWLLNDPTDGVINFVDEKFVGATQVRDAIKRVAQLYSDGCTEQRKWGEAAWVAGSATHDANWRTIGWAADAAADAADAAADTADVTNPSANYAALSAAETATDAAEVAAQAAAIAAVAAQKDEHRARVDARRAAYVKQSEKLLELLRAA
jgi:hypothetical protein